MPKRTMTEILELVEAGRRVPLDRGTCAVCLKRVPLRQDGTVGPHKHWVMECGGTGHEPTDDR